jgi:hypothetical protein
VAWISQRTKEALASGRREAGNPAVEIAHIRPARAIISDDGNRWYLRGKGDAIYVTFGILPQRSPQIRESYIRCNLAAFVGRSGIPNEDRTEQK